MKTESPLQIVIFGGTGDLSVRKLLPALMDLYVKKKLPKKFSLIGVARSEFSDEDYQDFVLNALQKQKHNHTKKDIDGFCKHIQFVPGLFDDRELYLKVRTKMSDNDESFKMCSNKLFYLAVPPQYYVDIFSMLHKYNLHKECDRKFGWARVLVEKPFGSDVDTARKLDKTLGSLFREEQIFRIDHYLAKEAVQNILSFRFANMLLKGVWNNNHISEMCITMYEMVDVGKRGSFYDGIGALRDVGQNHLLQLLALLTMDEPKQLEHKYIRKNRADILKKLRPLSKKNITDKFVRAQYAGYKKTKGVRKGSETETFFELTAEINSKRWAGVPIHISAGKALAEAKVEVEILFKDVASGPFLTKTCSTAHNKITLTISPRQEMRITLNAKTPGLGYQLESRTLTFDCPMGKSEVKNSYEKVLLDCINGDQTLFTTTEEVLAQWKYIHSILKYMKEVPLQTYKEGSAGPKKRI